MGEAILQVQDLHVGFGRRDPGNEVVRGVSFDLEPARCLAIVGESGSGKSVTARTLVGLAGDGSFATGRAELDGESLMGRSERSWRRLRGRRAGFVLQDALVSLDPLRPIGREIADALRLHTGLTATQRATRVHELLDAVGVPDPVNRARQRSGELSGGLRQRALIASAIALDPPLLICDEPTTALDATVQLQILDLIDELKAAGTAVLLISHDLAVVGRVADRVAVMHDGRFVEAGPTTDVLGAPQEDYTQRLLQAVPDGRGRGRRLSPAATRVHAAVLDRPNTANTADNGPVLEATHLGKTFRLPDGGTLRAVDDVSFTLGRGRTLGIVGESGSGKTTVARIALGLTGADAGGVRLLGGEWSTLTERSRRPLRSRIGVVAQDPLGSFDPRWTVEQILTDVLTDGARVRDASRLADVHELLDLVGLPATTTARRPRHLSGGQRQRVAIARALAHRPEVLVCDEPVSALDVSVQAQVLDLLVDIQRELGPSYLFISHDLGVVHHMSDEVLVMKDGAVVESGDASDVFTHPREDYTQRLLAASPRITTAAPNPAATPAATTAAITGSSS